jgi:hypothetical protein
MVKIVFYTVKCIIYKIIKLPETYISSPFPSTFKCQIEKANQMGGDI